MRCADVQKKSTAYLDGELDSSSASALRGHLRQCSACAERLAEEEQIRDAARDLVSNLDPPPALWQQIQRRLGEHEIADAERSPRERSLSWLWKQAPLFSGALAVAVLAFLLWPEPTPGQPALVQPTLRPEVLVTAPVLSVEDQQLAEWVDAQTRYTAAMAEIDTLYAGRNLATEAPVRAPAPVVKVLPLDPANKDFVMSRQLAALAVQRKRLDQRTRTLLAWERKR